VAVEIPKFSIVDQTFENAVVNSARITDKWRKWRNVCQFLREEADLRVVDLRVLGWFGDEGVGAEEVTSLANEDVGKNMKEHKMSDAEIREWEWVKEFLGVNGLENTRVSWWDFGKGGGRDFGDWMGRT